MHRRIERGREQGGFSGVGNGSGLPVVFVLNTQRIDRPNSLSLSLSLSLLPLSQQKLKRKQTLGIFLVTVPIYTDTFVVVVSQIRIAAKKVSLDGRAGYATTRQRNYIPTSSETRRRFRVFGSVDVSIDAFFVFAVFSSSPSASRHAAKQK